MIYRIFYLDKTKKYIINWLYIDVLNSLVKFKAEKLQLDLSA